MKTLYTIGDSFMSLDNPPGKVTSFLELYARAKGFEHRSLARPGATNFVIRLQIDEAIKNRADYVVVGNTCSDRFDFAIDPNFKTGYIRLDEILYRGYHCVSETDPMFENSVPRLVCDSFANILLEHHEKILKPSQRQALKTYIADLHNPCIQSQRDYYVISDGLRALDAAGIPFVFLRGWMANRDWSWVKRVWPADRWEPVPMPLGPNPTEHTVTHNDQVCHDNFFETLMQITEDWV